MSAESDLYAALSGAAAVTAIVGSGSSARIYPDVVPHDRQIPSIAYARVGTEFVGTIHTGAPAAQRAQIEIACMSTKRADAETLADAVLTAVGLAGFYPLDRRAELDTENNLWATVLTVDYLS